MVNFNNENEKKKEDVIIYDISAGKDYVLALDKNYQVWAWGSNARKQIDPFNEMKEINKPRKIGFIVNFIYQFLLNVEFYISNILIKLLNLIN